MSAPEIEGYKVIENGEIDTTYTEEAQTIVIKYEKEEPIPEDSKIVIKFVDTEGNVLKEDYEEIGKAGDNFHMEAPEIEGYKVVENEIVDTTFGEEVKVIIIKYEKEEPTPVEDATIIVKYEDTKGNVIKEETVVKGKVGEEFKMSAPEIEGYKVVENEEIDTIYKEEAQTIVIKYEKDEPTPVENATITVRYEDTEGNVVKEETVVKGQVGEEFKMTAPEIGGYKVVENEEIDTTFTEEEQVIVVKYEKEEIEKGKITIIYTDEEGNVIREEVKEGEIGDNFHMEAPEIEGYKVIENEVIDTTFSKEEKVIKIVYEKEEKPKEEGKVVIKIVDEEGNEIGEKVVTGEVGEEIEVELPVIEGYEEEEKIKIKIVAGEHTITVEYNKKEEGGDKPNPEKPDDGEEGKGDNQNQGEEENVNTGSINVVMYVVMFVGSAIVLKKKYMSKAR